MTLQDHLNKFYLDHNIPKNGGVDFNTFEVPLPFFKLILPNLSWRRKRLHIHDLEHILNKQDTTWRGEMFIASWEIATGFWKYFPLCIFPLWTMGWGLWKHPTSVFNGFRKGLSSNGIAGLNISREELLMMNLSDLEKYTLKRHDKTSTFSYILKLIFWLVISQFVFFLPLILFSGLILFLLSLL